MPKAWRPVRVAHRIGWRGIAAAASAGAGAIHLGATAIHLGEYAPAGAFMFLAGAGQLGWAVWIVSVRIGRTALDAAIAGNAAIATLWAASRTVGLPVGHERWTAEHVHPNDLLATGLEVLLIAAVLAMRRPHTFAPGPALTAVTALAVFGTLLVSEHDPVREHVVAAASLTLTAAACVVVPVFARTLVTVRERRRHERSFDGRARAGLGVAVGIAGGTGE